MTSQLNVDTIVDKAGSGGTNVKTGNTSTYVSDGGNVTQNTVQSLVKVWVNFNGGASGAAARDSFNVSSMTDHGSGNHTVTINSDMSNVNYSCSDSVGDHDDSGESFGECYTHTQAVGSVGVLTAHFSSGSLADRSNVSIQICGDLA